MRAPTTCAKCGATETPVRALVRAAGGFNRFPRYALVCGNADCGARLFKQKRLTAKTRLTTRRGLIKTADDLCRAIVRARGQCEYDGCTERDPNKLQWSHGIVRNYKAVRWDFALNGFCLCASHHAMLTTAPLEWADWHRRRIGPSEYTRLRQRALQGQRDGVPTTFIAAEVARLKIVATRRGLLVSGRLLSARERAENGAR